MVSGIKLFEQFAFDKSKNAAPVVDPVKRILGTIDEQIKIIETQQKAEKPTFAKYDWVKPIVLADGKPAWQVKIGHFPIEIAGKSFFAVEKLEQAVMLLQEGKKLIEGNVEGMADQVRAVSAKRSAALSKGREAKKK